MFRGSGINERAKVALARGEGKGREDLSYVRQRTTGAPRHPNLLGAHSHSRHRRHSAFPRTLIDVILEPLATRATLDNRRLSQFKLEGAVGPVFLTP